MLAFCLAVLFGSYVQAVAGFAMGMIMMASVGAFGHLSLPVLTAVVSLVSGINIFLSLKGRTRKIEFRLLAPMVAGQLPAIVLGVYLINTLDRDAQTLLQLLLGLFITWAGISMMLKPTPIARTSAASVRMLAGAGGGLFGGMFSASGPVVGWFLYRQPLAVANIRATLLAYFAIATVWRTLTVGVGGALTIEVWTLTAWSLPLVFLGTWIGHRFPPALTTLTIRRLIAALLIVLGLYICIPAALA